MRIRIYHPQAGGKKRCLESKEYGLYTLSSAKRKKQKNKNGFWRNGM